MSVIFFSTSSILSSSITTAKKGEKSRSEGSYLGLAGGGGLRRAEAEGKRGRGSTPADTAPSSSSQPGVPLRLSSDPTPPPGCVPARFCPSTVLRTGSRRGSKPAAQPAARARTGLVLTPRHPHRHSSWRAHLFRKKAPGSERGLGPFPGAPSAARGQARRGAGGGSEPREPAGTSGGRSHSVQPGGGFRPRWGQGLPPPRRPVPPRCLRADLASPESPLPRSEPLFAAGRGLARLSAFASLPISAWPAHPRPLHHLPERWSPVEVCGPLSLPGVSVALIVSATPASPLDSRPGSQSPRLRLALSRDLLIPASPCLRPRLPSPSLRLGLSRRLLVSSLVPEPLELLLEPRRVRVSPGLFQLPRLMPGLRKPPPPAK